MKIKSVRDSYLFDKHFGLIIALKCNIWLHGGVALTERARPPERATYVCEGFAQDLKNDC